MATHKEEFGDQFIEDFLKVFEEYSIGNRDYGRMILHVLLGQALKNIYFASGERRIDIRIHLLFIKPSGSGGGAGYSFYSRLARDLGLDDQMLTEASDAGLAGTGTTNERTGEPDVKHGLMETADLISMEEASVMFDYTTTFSRKNLTYLQIAMNPLHDASCFIRKKIGSLVDAIAFKPHCSFLLVTYLPERFVKELISRGVIQRFVNVFKIVSLEERSKVVDLTIDKMKAHKMSSDKEYLSVLMRLKIVIAKCRKLSGYDEGDKKYDYNEKTLDALLEGLFKSKLNEAEKDIVRNTIKRETKHFKEKDWFLKYGHEFKFTNQSYEDIRKVKNGLNEMIEDTTWIAQEKLEEFTHRNFEIIMRLAIHHAIICLRTTVETEDVIYANDVYRPIWKKVIYNVEDLLVPSEFQRLRFNSIVYNALNMYENMLKEKKFVREKVWVRRATLLERLQGRWDYCSMVTAHSRLQRIETNNPHNKNRTKYFLTKNFGDVPYVKKVQDIVR